MVNSTNSKTLSFSEYKTSTSNEYTVSEISTFIKRIVEENFGFVRIKGEISGLKIAPSGHAYFNLKDKKSVIAAVCWKNTISSIKHKPEEGLEVVCTGSVTTYAGQSRYQIVVQNINPAGIGALMALLEKRKQQFQKEGLFDQKHKKPLPFLPKTIGIITSPTGSVIKDMIHRISDRFPTRVILWPVLVQGNESAQQIAKAIYGFNNANPNITRPDILIVARGGGSIEDLWPFNEEIVSRAAFNSKIPIISAIGHETDTTLLDYVADVRAPTPTAAAELALPVKKDLASTVYDLENRIKYATERYISSTQEILTSFAHTLPNLKSLVNFYTQRLDEASMRLINSFSYYNSNMLQNIRLLSSKITSPSAYLQIIQNNLNHNIKELHTSYKQALKDKSYYIKLVDKLLNSYNYKNTLKRGFAIIRDEKKTIVKSSESTEDKKITIEFYDGTIKGFINQKTF